MPGAFFPHRAAPCLQSDELLTLALAPRQNPQSTHA
jgi:hypothetical protein